MALNEEVNYADVPDPDEEDLDDLDDVLDRFQASKIDEKQPRVEPDETQSDTAATQSGGPADTRAFSDELRSGMAELLGTIEDNPEMQAEFEKLMRGLDDPIVQEGLNGNKPDAVTANKGPATVSGSSKSAASDNSFQDTIQKTMERMRSSGESASAAAAAQSSEDDMLAKMLKEMESGKFPGMNGGSEEDFNKMLLGMMEQLTSKEVLYEPMKELHTKFPDWLEKNAATVKKEDLMRYKEQQALVNEIVTRFDKPGYADENQEDREYIVERMQKMQAAGSPPPDLVGDMGAAQDLMGDLDGGCNQQ